MGSEMGFRGVVKHYKNAYTKLEKQGNVPVDYKTCASTPNLTLESFAHQTQLLLYQILLEENTGGPNINRLSNMKIERRANRNLPSPRLISPHDPTASPPQRGSASGFLRPTHRMIW
jgi:hypothetical protein